MSPADSLFIRIVRDFFFFCRHYFSFFMEGNNLHLDYLAPTDTRRDSVSPWLGSTENWGLQLSNDPTRSRKYWVGDETDKYDRWGCHPWGRCISGTTRILAKQILQKHDPNCDLSSYIKYVYFLAAYRPTFKYSIFWGPVFAQLCFASNILLSAIRRIVGKLKSIAFRRTYAQVYSVPVNVGMAATKSRWKYVPLKQKRKYWAKNKNSELLRAYLL